MSSLARIAHLRGFSVSGSDRADTPVTRSLSAGGITVYSGHSAENVNGADALVYTVAIAPDNPEYLRAKQLGIPVISRADFLGWIMTAYDNRIGVSGTHGKSTCTSMLSHIFIAAGEDPTVVSGAETAEMNGAYRIGGRRHIIFESCEYMDNFLCFSPTVAVVLNEEYDHGDYYPDMAAVRRSFTAFMQKPGCLPVVNADDENVRLSLEAAGSPPCISFGLSEAAGYRAVNITEDGGHASFDINVSGEAGCAAHISLSVFGRHNVYNALAAFAVSDRFGISRAVTAAALSDFPGALRRMEYKGRVSGCRIYEDYAHHPTEIRATLTAAREACKGRLVCIFQPHTYSRTYELFDGFISALSLADHVIIADIYSARETDTLGVSSEKLAQSIGGKAEYIDSMRGIAERVRSTVSDGDIAIVMGAGNINLLTPMLF